jgi:hypothetical protein
MQGLGFKDVIKEKRPRLAASSIQTYNSILRNLAKNVFGDENVAPEKFSETDKILDYLKDLPPNRRKTILSALVVLTDEKKYRDLMLADIEDYSREIAKQEKTQTQVSSWIEPDDIKTLWERMKRNVDLLYKKTHITTGDLQEIQQFVLLSLLGGMFIPPRRALDYCLFKIKDIDKTKDNYLDKATMVFNTYKTARTYGEQKVGVPPTLRLLLVKWIKVNPTDHLFFDSNMNPLSSVKLNQRLNKIFDGRKVGVNSLRHSYLTGKYKETIETNRRLAQDMTSMGSSMNMAHTYIKN